jgi:putative inorganic carbon (HCO3(-)) transporter
MRDLFLLLILTAYAGLGLVAPFAAGLGYIWVDFLAPQQLGFGLLAELPIAMLIGAWTFLLYFALDRRNAPRISGTLILLAIFGAWVTLTTTWALVPEFAWVKWDRSVKMIAFAIFVPFLFRTRAQIEAMLLTLLFATFGTVLAFGVKVAISGGGYGMQLGLFQENSLLGEGSTLAATALAAVPIALGFARGSMILPWRWVAPCLAYVYSALAVVTALGGYTRTGLVALITLFALFWWRARRKIVFGALIIALIAVGISTSSERWTARMATIPEYGDDVSALSRIGVWKWTLGFVAENPLGGGFDAYRINRAVLPIENQPGQVIEIQSRAFHSSYFEVLGEHGIPGLALYLALLAAMFLNLRTAARSGGWMAGLAVGIAQAALIYMVSGLFVGLAFQPFLYYLTGASVALRELQRRKTGRLNRALNSKFDQTQAA